ncbi:MAG: SurA N-terminal domain-containing protein [Candidatus Hydrogenedentota bacterium]
MRKVTRWIWCFTGAAAIGICGGLGGMTAADAQQDPPSPPVEEEPAPQEPAPAPEEPAPQEPAPAPEEPAPQEQPPMPEDPPAPAEPPAALPEVDTPETVAVIEGDEETAEVTGDTFDWVLDRVNELLQRQPQMDAPEHEDILDALVDQQVFVADAKEAGVEITEDDVQAEIDEIKESIPEEFEFEDALAQEGLTEDQFRSMMGDQLHVQAYIEELAEQDEYEDLELTSQEEISELLSVLMFELDATQHQVMAARVDDVRDEYDIETNVDFDDVEAPEPEEPAAPEQPMPQQDEPAPMPEPDEEEPAPQPQEPAPMPEPDEDEPAPQPQEPAPQPM